MGKFNDSRKLSQRVLCLVIFVAGLMSAGQVTAACKATFKYSVSGTTVTFTNASSSVGKAMYKWIFGDGTAGTNAVSPSHTYANYATAYTVKLYLFDSSTKCMDSPIQSVVTGKATACKASQAHTTTLLTALFS